MSKKKKHRCINVSWKEICDHEADDHLTNGHCTICDCDELVLPNNDLHPLPKHSAEHS